MSLPHEEAAAVLRAGVLLERMARGSGIGGTADRKAADEALRHFPCNARVYQAFKLGEAEAAMARSLAGL